VRSFRSQKIVFKSMLILFFSSYRLVTRLFFFLSKYSLLDKYNLNYISVNTTRTILKFLISIEACKYIFGLYLPKHCKIVRQIESKVCQISQNTMFRGRLQCIKRHNSNYINWTFDIHFRLYFPNCVNIHRQNMCSLFNTFFWQIDKSRLI